MGARGGGGAVLVTLLMTSLGGGPALRCPLCHVGNCSDVTCPAPYDVCRRTSLTVTSGRHVTLQEEAGCDVSGSPDVIVTFRSHGETLTLREERWGEGQRPPPWDPAPNTGSPPPPLTCFTCDSSDGSCERPLAAIACPRPSDRCIDVITRRPGQGWSRVRGCGSAPSCGVGEGLGLETGNGRAVRVGCGEPPPHTGEEPVSCWACDGPEPHGCAPQVLSCPTGLPLCGVAWTHGPSGEPWLLRGCVTPGWCRAPVGLRGLRGGRPPKCCRGGLCNRLPGDPPGDPQKPPGTPSSTPSIGLSLLLLLLLIAAPHL